jgi:hypothetical protein
MVPTPTKREIEYLKTGDGNNAGKQLRSDWLLWYQNKGTINGQATVDF